MNTMCLSSEKTEQAIKNGESSDTSNIAIRVIVLNTTFNKISVISWGSVSLVEETGVLEEIHRTAASH
jgi:hypothetical protein